MKTLISRIKRDERGSTLIEFAILAPVIIGMFFGVVQVGMSMQSYNAMRGAASDTARYAVIEYMKENEVTDAALKTQAETIAKAAPYMLGSNVIATVTPVASPRVSGTFEKTLTITYTPPSVLPLFDYTSSELTFSRPIFLIDE
ncbi:TadE/TadG family type IV pilus assembly protein [Qipengyuania marisflavi]|uniref:Pilus assembly protein n=1 Tax=Qipengyuania marisflavi TaxID=2486356 RepID=A0A5S3P8W6_9SPHN|nr:TadE/TadG family type IV pilus assembly protein [Qipengyuania marisflavi]TMM49949.1 pilus assembly protein [Qipengyuania marisflavi]